MADTMTAGDCLEQRRNYFERLVDLELDEDSYKALTADQRLDASCLALNKLPPRYYRHDVDFSFYCSDEDADDFAAKVRDAVAQAVHELRAHPVAKARAT